MSAFYALCVFLLAVGPAAGDAADAIVFLDEGVKHMQTVDRTNGHTVYLEYTEVHEDFVEPPKYHYVDEYVDEDRYFVREHVYSLKRLQYERRIAGNASGCLQYTERGSERLCEYVPGGVGNTLANVIAYISEGFQQGDVRFDGWSRREAKHVLYWSYDPTVGDFAFEMSTQLHTQRGPIRKIVARSRSRNYHVSYMDVRMHLDPVLPVDLLDTASACEAQSTPAGENDTFAY